MSIELPFASNALTTFIYEPFSYTISNPPGSSTLSIGTTAGIPAGYLVNNGSNVVFSTSSNGMVVGTSAFNVLDSSGNTSSNTVTVRAGRFLDFSGNSFAGQNFPFYKNEPISPITLVAPFEISTPTTVPTLPPGLTYTSNDSNIFTITGTPIVTVPQSNYLVIGKGSGSNLGKTVTSQFGMSVSNERILTTLEGSPIVSPMTIGTPIPERVITAAFPPYPYGGTMRYTWAGLPDGIFVTDITGTPQGSPFTASLIDPSSTLVIKGTPTVAAANAFKNADITSNVVSILATRTNPLPLLSNTIPITFGFGETVLFDPVTVPPLYSGVPVASSAVTFRAQTYFGSGSSIANIYSPDLRADLSLVFFPGQGRADLTGTPISTGTATYTIRAVNSSLVPVTQDLAVPITVANDTISFLTPTPNPLDACYNFVLSRPISSFLPGYYTSNVEFRAVAGSGNAITFTSSGLAGTGLSLSNVGSNTARLVGIPTTVTPLTTATVTASAVGTPATASTTFKFVISNDDISFSQPTPTQLSFIQNRAITPIQLSATTLSERPVISYLSSNMPTGLSISTTGLISGTPIDSTAASFDVVASTGYMTETKTYTPTLTPDSIILIERPQPSYSLTLGGPIPPATVSGLSYSGTSVSNFVFSNLPVTYGMTIGNTTGVFGGTFTTSYPPDPLLPETVSFSVYATAGLLTAGLSGEIFTINAPQYQWYTLKGKTIGKAATALTDWSTLTSDLTTIDLTDYSVYAPTALTRTFAAVTHTREVVQSPDGIAFTKYDLPLVPWPFYDTPGAPFQNPDAEFNMGPNAIARDTATSTTLYGVGYNGGATNIGAFWKSTDNGITWNCTFPLLASGLSGTSWLPYAFFLGNAINYKSGVLLIGGAALGNEGGLTVPDYLSIQSSIIRSTNGGSTWSAVTGYLQSVVYEFNTVASRWIAVGSDTYYKNYTFGGETPAVTIRYSDDEGLTWTAATGGPEFISEYVTYGNGIWIVGGRNYNSGNGTYSFALASSTDGATWTTFTLPGTWYPMDPPVYPDTLSDFLDSVLYDGENFLIVTSRNDDGSIGQKIWSHAASGSFSSDWEEVSSAIQIGGNEATSRLKGRVVAVPPVGVFSSTLSFPSQVGNGPTVTSPANTSILLYQYVPITPIQLSATGTGTVYFFVRDAELPLGLTFNSVTNTISGTPMQLGNNTVTMYVKDNVGVTLLTLGFTVNLATVERQQSSAGAWTSLLRQYTIVNAAQNSVNGKALPATDPPLGEFMRPYPPDVVKEDPCKKCE
jgi:hypothetical protein